MQRETDWVETMRWAYELRGNVSAFMDQNGQAWQYAYDSFNPASQLTGFEEFSATAPPGTISATLPHNGFKPGTLRGCV